MGNINVSLASSLGSSLCYNELDSITLTGYGAENFTWSLGTPNSPFFLSRITGDTAILRKQPNTILDSTYTLNVIVNGTMGTCTDTARQQLEFIQASNDNIANAIELGLGKSREFSNFCATIEATEPVPPADSCTGVKSWCDEYGTGKNIVENSVWFKFKGPATGKAGLKSLGFDNEIAVYEANSYQDILNGAYTLLAANDDESDVNANPTIAEIKVQPGKMYWVQVDGSGGGSEGFFTITLSDRNITPTPEITEETDVVIYPQPVSDVLTIQSDYFQNGFTQINIYNLSGKTLLEKNFIKLDASETSINVESLSPGIYLLKLMQGEKTTIKKFIKN